MEIMAKRLFVCLGLFKRIDQVEHFNVHGQYMRTSMGEEGKSKVYLRYERLANLCYYCGTITHENEECMKKFEDLRKGIPVEEIQHHR